LKTPIKSGFPTAIRWVSGIGLFIFIFFVSAKVSVAQTHSFTIDFNTLKKDVSSHPIGINMDYLVDDDTYDPLVRTTSTTDALINMGVNFLRFPGGEKSDNYIWSQDYQTANHTLALSGKCNFPNSEPEFTVDGKTLKNETLDFDEFLQIVKATGTTPLIVVNGDGHHQVNDNCDIQLKNNLSREYLVEVARQWVRYAKNNYENNNGAKIKYWMIGNESWGATTGTQYAEDIIAFATAMKAEDPEIKIVVNGKIMTENNGRSWWQNVLTNSEAAKLIDYLGISVFPVYNWIGGYNDYLNPLTRKDPKSPTNTKAVNLTKEFTNEIITAQKAITSYSVNKNIRIIVSETNSIDWGPFFENGNGWLNFNNDLAHALVAFDIIGRQLTNEKVDLNFFWNTRYYNYNGTAYPYGKTLPVQNALKSNGEFQANGLALSLWGNFLLDKVDTISLSNKAPIVVYASSNDLQQNVILINKDHTEQSIDLTLNNTTYTGAAKTFVFKSLEPTGDLRINDTNPSFKEYAAIEPISNSNVAGKTTTSNYSFKVDPTSITILQISKPYVSLPVELLNFRATQQGKQVKLSWQTASEKDNTGFEVQVSSDAKTFRRLAFISSLTKGNSNQLTSYSYTDLENNKNGIRYYRLKQTDFNGQEAFSDIKAVKSAVLPQLVKVYPNPAENIFDINFISTAENFLNLEITDAFGKIILSKQVPVTAGENSIKVPFGNAYAPGIYILRVISDEIQKSIKLVKK